VLKQLGVIGALFLALVGSSVAMVHSKYTNRLLFNHIQRLQRQSERLDVEWEQLLIEEHALTDHGRVESLARSRLKMKMPAADEITYLHVPEETHD